MGTAKQCHIQEMKICAFVVKLDANNGNKKAVIIDVHCPKLLCFDSKLSLGAGYGDEVLKALPLSYFCNRPLAKVS